MTQTQVPFFGRKWRVVGYDTFAAGSEGGPESAWYELGKFATEAEAMACAASAVEKDWKPDRLRDHVYVVGPDGKRCRCVLDYCPECGKTVTDCNKKPSMMLGQTKYICEHCGSELWRSAGKVVMIVKKDRDRD